MTNDYLWNRSGTPEEDVADLERLLSRFALPARADAQRSDAASPPLPLARRFVAAAAVLVIACASTLWRGEGGPSWPVVRLAGAPRAGSVSIGEAARLDLGDWLETDGSSRASLAVSTIGRLDVEPNTRVRLVETRDGAHRLLMAHGRIHALIWAPPGQFVVDTPSSRAIDLGCAYTLEVRPDGSGTIEVSAGWVAFEHDGREAFIPAGARCDTRPRLGPGTPHMDDAPAALVEALAAFDFESLAPAARRQALGRVLAAARREDAVTLWHLIVRAAPADRDQVFDALARVVPPPVLVTREGIRAGDAAMRDAWWNALGLGDVEWWRTWKRSWR